VGVQFIDDRAVDVQPVHGVGIRTEGLVLRVRAEHRQVVFKDVDVTLQSPRQPDHADRFAVDDPGLIPFRCPGVYLCTGLLIRYE
jgi:hypothetical protein